MKRHITTLGILVALAAGIAIKRGGVRPVPERLTAALVTPT
jgi:hypothetical protein